MIRRTEAVAAICAAVIILTIPAAVRGQESLITARQLYAAADYRTALTMLDRLLAGDPLPGDRQAMSLYRAFCLVALGNADEARMAIDAMVTRDPLYRPNMDDVPPRLRAVFSDARKRLLPSLIQEKYVGAKVAFDKGDFKTAAEGFTQVLIGLSDPDIAAAAKLSPLSDLRVLASSFNDLTVRALTPPPVAAAPPPPAPITPPVAENTVANAPSPRIYTINDTEVVQPVVLNQDVPAFPGRVTRDRSGVIEVIIDQTGAVESASILEPVEPLYNRLVLAAAKTWMYRPARLDGAPVKFRKRIQLSLTQE